MFRKFIIIIFSLFVVFLTSCEDTAIDPAAEAAAREIAEDLAGWTMLMGIQVNPGGEVVAGTGLNRMITAGTGFDESDIENEPAGLTFSGGISSYDDPVASISLTMQFDDVQSDDEVWTINGSLFCSLDVTFGDGESLEGSLTGSLIVSDGSAEYSFVFDISITGQQSSDDTYSCTVGGTVEMGSHSINIDESFTYIVSLI